MLYKQLLITYKKIVSICIIKFSKNKIQFFLREKDLSKPSKTSLEVASYKNYLQMPSPEVLEYG